MENLVKDATTFGLLPRDLEEIIGVLEQRPEVEEAHIYGSRARGDYKRGSDVDIALIGEDVTFSTLAWVHGELEEETMMPYFFDVLHLDTLENEKLREEINSQGKCIYRRESA